MDFEHLCEVKLVTLSLGTPARYRYVIEAADREGNWRPLIDRSSNTKVVPELLEPIPDNTRTRLLRIVFSPLPGGSPIQLHDVSVMGAPLQ